MEVAGATVLVGVGNALLGLAGLVALLVVPGHLLLRRRLPAAASPWERWALTAGLGLWAVASVVSFGLLVPWSALGLVDRAVLPWLLPVSAIVLSGAGWLGGARKAPIPRPSPSRGDLAVLVGAAVVFALYFVGLDDQYYAPTCLYTSAVDLLEPGLRHTGLRRENLLLSFNTSEQYGNIFLALVFLSGFQRAGVRVASGVAAALLFLCTAALARRLTGRRVPSLLAAAALLVTGDVWESQIVNTNMFVAFTSALFLLVTSTTFRALCVARTFSGAMLFCSRYVSVLGLGALFWVHWRDSRGESLGRRLARLVGHGALLVLITLPVHLTHQMSQGTPLHWASREEYSARIHAFLGLEFSWHGMWNFPFHESLVRTPFNPFPMWVGWPVHWVGQWGAVGVALAALGVWQARRSATARETLGPWLLFSVPVALFLGFQENWLQPEKLTIGLVLAPPFAALLALGLTHLAELAWRPRLLRAGLALGVTVGALWGAGALLARTEVPEDARFRDEYPDLRQETPAFRAFLRERALRPSWTPLPRAPGLFHAWHRKPGDAFRTVVTPAFAERPHTMHETILDEFLPSTYRGQWREARTLDARPPGAPGSARTLVLDLEQAPTLAERPLRLPDPVGAVPGDPGREPPVLELGGLERCARTSPGGLAVAFSDQPVHVVACRLDESEVFVALAPPAPLYDRGAEAVALPNPRSSLPPAPTRRVVLHLPATTARVSLVELLYMGPMRAYLRDVELAADGGARAKEPVVWRHN